MKRVIILFLAALLLAVSPVTAADSPKIEPAQIKISGYGFWGNRMLKRTLRTMELAPKKAEVVDAGFVEDAAFILRARVRRDGFLSPHITADLEAVDGTTLQVNAEDLIANPLPRPLLLRKVHFRIRKGPLYHYENLRFQGLTAIPESKALTYFVETGAFIALKNGRIFTPEKLRRSLMNLGDALNTLGYRDAVVSNLPPQMNPTNGAVDVVVTVEEGPKYLVSSVTEQIESEVQPRSPKVYHPNKPYSRLWTQEFSQQLKTNLYARGYPDADVTFETLRQERAGTNTFEVDLLARLQPGPLVRVGDIVLKGHKHTRTDFIRRRVRVERGELLNPIRIERARFRLAELGAFESVGLDYAPVDQDTRDVIFQFQESKRFNLSVLLGWGSYEMLRGGF
jgi:outer membrane protein assembly factor BamA